MLTLSRAQRHCHHCGTQRHETRWGTRATPTGGMRVGRGEWLGLFFFFPFFFIYKTPRLLPPGWEDRENPGGGEAVPGPGTSCLPCQSPCPLAHLLLKITIIIIY